MDSASKGSDRGLFGIDCQVARDTHYSHDTLIGQGIGFKTATQSRDEEAARQMGGEDVREKMYRLMGWKIGGKNRRTPDSGVKATPTPERVEVRAGMMKMTPKWVELVRQFGHQLTPQERESVEATIAASAGLHDTLREYLSRPAGPQVM